MSEQVVVSKQLPIAERRRLGRNHRKQRPRSSHAEWTPEPNRRNPIKLLQPQDKGHIKKLLPIKYGRMLASPFAFYRGSSSVMASDLASTPVSGLDVILCGDANLSNFGIFTTPERNLIFDINDFDEAIGDFALAYATQTEQDYQMLVETIRSGHIQVQKGI